jgi:amino acid transporter
VTSESGAKGLRFFFVVMVMFGITTTLHGLSPLATYGLGAVFFLLLAVVAFLIPAGMVATELATTWQRDGGVFVWVGEAFGEEAGFLATWLQWLQDVIFWTVILTGSAAMLAYGFGWEAGAENKVYVVSIVVGTILLTSILTMFGLRSTGWVGTVGSSLTSPTPRIWRSPFPPS